MILLRKINYPELITLRIENYSEILQGKGNLDS